MIIYIRVDSGSGDLDYLGHFYTGHMDIATDETKYLDDPY